MLDIDKLRMPPKRKNYKPSLLKVRVLLKNGRLRFINEKIIPNTYGISFDIKSVQKDNGGCHGASQESAEAILTIPIEDFIEEQTKFILEGSFYISPNGQLMDDITDTAIGTSNGVDTKKLLELAKAVDGQCNVIKQMEAYYQALEPFAYGYANMTINNAIK